MKTHYKVALAGNPNCGKTCIFNALTGTRQHVGNYPGVTVESKSGTFELNGKTIELIDLPGVYSLSSGSPEEMVVFAELTKMGIDLIINVIDSSIPRRNLYLTTQLAELHIPMLLAFNMSDDADRKGLKFDIPKLERYFGSPIVRTIGSKASGVKPLLDRLEETLQNLDNHGMPMLSYGADVDDAIAAVSAKIDSLDVRKYVHIPSRFFAIKLLEHDNAALKIKAFEPAWDEVERQIQHLRDKHAIEADTFMADRRYAMLAGACREAISMNNERRREISDSIDNVLTNKYLGLPLFLVIIYITFFISFTCADPFMDWIEEGFDWLGGLVGGFWSEETLPWLRSLLIDGVIAGVGGVLVFVPNIMFLFFAIAILEESGYMSRAAFIMDGIMRKFGLQGRSFVPLVLGFGCNVPAIMATRTIESERDRKVTIMILPLMSCGARLPIYALIIPAFFAERYGAFVMWLIYVIGVIVALIAAFILKSTLFKGDGEVYLMELPPYRMPTLRSLLLHMWDRGRMYLRKAGTIILAASVILFICNTFPEKKVFSEDYDAQIEAIENDDAPVIKARASLMAEVTGGELDEDAQALLAGLIEEDDSLDKQTKSELLDAVENNAVSAASPALLALVESDAFAETVKDGLKAPLLNAREAEALEYTISGRVGKALEPMFRPIGFDWKLTTASIAALAAKEVFVSQLGILYSEGKIDDVESEEETRSLRDQLAAAYTPLQGFCIMIFALFSIPCFATLAVIKRELNSWKMAAFEAAGLFILAYCITLVVYQTGMALGIGQG